MRHTPIPDTDLTPSALCLGCADLGGSTGREMSITLLDAFVDKGGMFLDTAKVYSDWIPGETSRSEKLLGEWMCQRKNRARLIVATKGAHPDLNTMHVPRLSPSDISADLNASLDHLQTDWIDLYWLHRDDPGRPVAEILETLEAQVKAGKIRWYACSNWHIERLEAAQSYAAEHGLQGFAATQVLWNLARVDPSAVGDPTIVVMDENLHTYQRRTGLAAIPFSSQANGLFQKMAAGKIDSLSPLQMYLTEETRQRFQRLQMLRAKTGFSITQIVLGYLTGQPFPTIPIFSARSLEQLEDSLSAAEVALTPEQITFLEMGK